MHGRRRQAPSVGDLDKHLHGFQAIHDCLESCIRRFRLYRISMHFPYMRYGKGCDSRTDRLMRATGRGRAAGLHLGRVRSAQDAHQAGRPFVRRPLRQRPQGYSSPCTPCTSQGSVSPSKQTRPFRRNRPCPYRSWTSEMPARKAARPMGASSVRLKLDTMPCLPATGCANARNQFDSSARRVAASGQPASASTSGESWRCTQRLAPGLMVSTCRCGACNEASSARSALLNTTVSARAS